MVGPIVSVVDGFNIPMSITNNKGCHEASCEADLNPNCTYSGFRPLVAVCGIRMIPSNPCLSFLLRPRASQGPHGQLREGGGLQECLHGRPRRQECVSRPCFPIFSEHGSDKPFPSEILMLRLIQPHPPSSFPPALRPPSPRVRVRTNDTPLLANNPNCCTGTHNTAATCPSSGVQYYSYFSASPLFFFRSYPLNMHACPLTENSCKDSYVFAYDEPSGTALWTCDGNKAADYTITFCP